ncbi:hypothetical protein [Psychromonas hadalis]|uniref:hypothetical protein n=1 Tax=Psychromonas hadalis TaxID=211669 RepID=UPI0003B519E4|nr:hypothetical protein [Psychromonas hadalis]
MLTKSRVVQLLLMLLVLMALFFWRTFDTPPQEAFHEKGKVSLVRCDYVEACEFMTDQGAFFLTIKNHPIKAEEWINFELSSPIKNIQIENAKIVGKTMFMGRIPVTFKKTSEQHFSAKSLVGACTTPKMAWELQIAISVGDKSKLLMFDFMVER